MRRQNENVKYSLEKKIKSNSSSLISLARMIDVYFHNRSAATSLVSWSEPWHYLDSINHVISWKILGYVSNMPTGISYWSMVYRSQAAPQFLHSIFPSWVFFCFKLAGTRAKTVSEWEPISCLSCPGDAPTHLATNAHNHLPFWGSSTFFQLVRNHWASHPTTGSSWKRRFRVVVLYNDHKCFAWLLLGRWWKPTEVVLKVEINKDVRAQYNRQK